jgi:hypothetical protein
MLQPYRLTTPTPVASHSFKYTMAARTALYTSAVRRQTPSRDIVPVAADQHGAAAATMGGLADGIVNIAGIDITKTCVSWRSTAPRKPAFHAEFRRTPRSHGSSIELKFLQYKKPDPEAD